MATQRLVNTNFWKDNYIAELDPIEKLLFLYFITNPQTTLAGVYEINIREVAFDTGIDRDMILKILSRFCVDGKMYYENNWLVLNNFIKHQRLNPSIIRGIEKAIDELPEWLQNKISIESTESNQIDMFLSVDSHTGNSLGTDTPQYKEIKRNIKKIKEKKSKQNESGGFDDSKKVTKVADPKNYSRAVRADESLAEKESMARSRGGGSTKSVGELFGGISHAGN